jgi:hypothetical protein
MKSITTLLQAMRDDPLINKRIINILMLESYPRRLILSNWLEQLRRKNAPRQLTTTLSYLFDDTIAEKVLRMINKSRR